jgi:hypothetical protein
MRKTSMFKHNRNVKGQSTVEYIVLVTAVVGCIILFMNGSGSPFQKKVNEALTTTAEGMASRAEALDKSHPEEKGKDTTLIGANASAHPFKL